MAILSTAPEGARVLDLDAVRAARAEARGGASVFVKVTAGYVEMRPEVDLEAAEEFLGSHFKAGLAKLVVDPADAEALWVGGLSKADLDAIGEFVTGTAPGESPAS